MAEKEIISTMTNYHRSELIHPVVCADKYRFGIIKNHMVKYWMIWRVNRIIFIILIFWGKPDSEIYFYGEVWNLHQRERIILRCGHRMSLIWVHQRICRRLELQKVSNIRRIIWIIRTNGTRYRFGIQMWGKVMDRFVKCRVSNHWCTKMQNGPGNTDKLK